MFWYIICISFIRMNNTLKNLVPVDPRRKLQITFPLQLPFGMRSRWRHHQLNFQFSTKTTWSLGETGKIPDQNSRHKPNRGWKFSQFEFGQGLNLRRKDQGLKGRIEDCPKKTYTPKTSKLHPLSGGLVVFNPLEAIGVASGLRWHLELQTFGK